MIAVAEERNALRERVTQLDGGVAEAERLRKVKRLSQPLT